MKEGKKLNKRYILIEIKRANKLIVLIFNFLYKLNIKLLNKTIYRLTEINDILTNLEIYLKGDLNNE